MNFSMRWEQMSGGADCRQENVSSTRQRMLENGIVSMGQDLERGSLCRASGYELVMRDIHGP